MKKSAVTRKTSDRAAAAAVRIGAGVQQRIRRHARTSMDAEICGVLIGDFAEGATLIENTIEGQGARQAGTHVTFTQETWAHVYEVKDAQYPEKRIVGWYHSHPGFGVFLSEHDIFIHKNFFSDPNQVAWVFDPHSDEEGCFVWRDGEIVRLKHLEVENRSVHGVESPHPEREASRGDPTSAMPGDAPGDSIARRSFGGIGSWAGLTLSHLLVLILGFLISLFFFGPEVIYVPVAAGPAGSPGQPQAQSPVQQQRGKEQPK